MAVNILSHRKKIIYASIVLALLALILTLHFATILSDLHNYLKSTNNLLISFLIYTLIMVSISTLCLPQTPIEALAALLYPLHLAILFAFVSKQIACWTCFAIAYHGLLKLSDKQDPRDNPPISPRHKVAPTPSYDAVPATLSNIAKEVDSLSGKGATRKNMVLYLNAVSCVINSKPHTLTCLISAAYLPSFLKNYGIGLLCSRNRNNADGITFHKHFLPWNAIVGLPYSVANVMVGASAVKRSRVQAPVSASRLVAPSRTSYLCR